MRRTFSMVVLFLVATLAGRADAQPRPAWDSRGWQMLGEQTVSGRVDRDRITVGRYEGRFTKLNLVVLDSELELIDFNIVFADNTSYAPQVAQYFREGQRTRAFDLPPGERVIDHIDLTYRNLPGGGRARVQIWGLRAGGAPPPPPPPPPPAPAPPAWDSRGWQLLGEQVVSGRVDRDRVTVGRYEGRFSKLTLVVLDSDLELLDFTINFANRTQYQPRVSHYFREGQRTRVIDLPPQANVISWIDLTYRNLPGGGRARVQVWGWRIGDAPLPPPLPRPPVVWDSRGWTMLGERTVNGRGREDIDRIEVGRYEGRFTKLTVVVLDSDLEMLDFAVKFGRGPAWHPGIQHYFREHQRTRVIDLPGDERTIKDLEFRYRNLPGGGRAKVQVWGWRSDGAPPPPPPPPPWDSRGWQLLGEQVVSGRIDIDKIQVGRYQGRFRQLMIVVLDSDLEMIDLTVRFARGEAYHPAISQYFRENTRTRAIDLPGDERMIRWIEFRYRNLPGGGRARVQAWAK